MITANDVRGIVPPIVTPITDDESIDVPGLQRAIHHLLENGVHGIFALGSTGNFCSFTAEERDQILRIVVNEVRRRVPVYAGCLDMTPRLVIQAAQRAAQIGADAVVVEAPFYFICGPEETLAHYQAVAQASPLPVIIYNNPENTQAHIGLELTKKLAAIPNIIGIKDSSYDFVYHQSLLMEYAKRPFSVMQGQEGLAGISFLLGGQGSVLSMSNVAPRLCVDLFHAGQSGDLVRMWQLQGQLMQVAQLCRFHSDDPALSSDNGKETTATWLAGLQCGMSLLGICDRVIPTPHALPLQAEYERARALLVSAGVL
jgi:dihydrodipicolinate synthase/N-acetylneuraminate lyase